MPVKAKIELRDRLLLEARRRGVAPQERWPDPVDYRDEPDWFHSGQSCVWISAANDIIACAGTQGGKTCIEAQWLLREIQRCAPLIKSLGDGKFLYVGPTLKLLGAQAIPHFQRLFETDLNLGRLIRSPNLIFRFSEAGLRNVLGFSNCPVTVSFAYASEPNNLESMTALAGVWDEAGQTDNKRESYEAFDRRLTVARSTRFGALADNAPDWWRERFLNVEGPDATFGRRLWGTTPYEWGWFKNEVVNRADPPDGGHAEEGFAFINWPSWSNPRVDEAACRKRLDLGMPLWRWQMMYLGKFTKPAGIIYDTFDFALDTCEDFDLTEGGTVAVRIYPGVDFGSANTGAVLLAQREGDPNFYLISDYRAGNRTFAEHVNGIRKIPSVLQGAVNFQPGAAGSHQEEGWREAFRAAGLALDEPPVNDVEVQIGFVYSLIKAHRLIMFRSCQRTIEQLQSYSRELGDDGEPTEKIADKASYHILDGLRYVVSKVAGLFVPPYSAAPSRQALDTARPAPKQVVQKTEDGSVVIRPGMIRRR